MASRLKLPFGDDFRAQRGESIATPRRMVQTRLVRYECDQCGACCKQLLIEADWLDVQREPRLLQADKDYASLPIVEAMTLLEDEYRSVIVGGPGRTCQFLCENKCSIYPTRPNVCVGMQAGDEQCQEAREREALPPLAPIA